MLFIALLIGLLLAQVPPTQRGCFEGPVTIRNLNIPANDTNYRIKSHKGYIWYVTPPMNFAFATAMNVTEKFVDEGVMRLEIHFGEPVAYTEVMIRRMHNLVEGPTDSSFTDGFLKFGEPYSPGCCLHSTIDREKALNYIGSSAPGTTFYVPRSDGWTEVRLDSPVSSYTPIGGSYCSANISRVLLEKIFNPVGTRKASWEQVNNDCPLKCKVQANFVFVLDGSGSIDYYEWQSLVNVLKMFVDNVQISADATHVGFVMYTAAAGPDKHCIIKGSGAGVTTYDSYYTAANQVQFDNQYFKNLWSSAIIDDSWYNNIDWMEWNSGSGFSHSVCFSAAFNTNTGGLAWLALYLSDVETLVKSFVSQELPFRPRSSGTGTGTGISLGLQLFDRAAVERPAVPDKMVVITDGESNAGQTSSTTKCDSQPLNPLNLRGISNLARLSGIEVFGVGIGDGVNVVELNYIGTGCNSSKGDCFPGYTYGDGQYNTPTPNGDDPHVFIASAFTLTALQPLLNQLLDVECIDASAAGTLCSADCGDNFCTACGKCVQCTLHNECPQYPCQFCTPDLTCKVTSTSRVCSEVISDVPTACESYACLPENVPEANLEDPLCANKTKSPSGETYELECRNRDLLLACVVALDEVKVNNAMAVCDSQKKTFVLKDFNDEVECTCQSETDHEKDDAALIAGTSAGGLFLLCIGCLLPCLLLLCLLAVLTIVVLAVILILIIIFLLVLLYGIRLAIPPKIHGTAVDNPTHVTAQDNPLARESGWHDAPELD